MGYADIMDTLAYWSAKTKIEETHSKRAQRAQSRKGKR